MNETTQQQNLAELKHPSASSRDAGEAVDTVRSAIRQNAICNSAYITMNALSTVIACYGLFADSAAVVIGAMIVATLLGPISGIALALVDGNNDLLRMSLLASVSGAAIAFGIAFVIGMVNRDLPATHEMLSRTSPDLLDLMIALAGGAAGAYANINPNLSVGLVGVAIATALVPPLATSGLYLARGDTKLAAGAFLLYFANLVAIQFASSVVMWVMGYHRITDINSGTVWAWIQNLISLGLLIILGAVLGVNLSRTVAKQQFIAGTRSALATALKAYPGSELADLRFEHNSNGEVVIAVVRAPYSFDPSRVSQMQAKLPRYQGKRLELHIRAVLTKETTPEGYLQELPPSSGEAPKGSEEPSAP